MMLSKEQWQKWEQAVSSKVTVNVLNTMLELATSGEPKAIELLKIAGENISSSEKKWLTVPISDENGRRLSFDEFREWCITKVEGKSSITRKKLKETDNIKISEKAKVFISYNHADATCATRLALELSQDPEVDVIIDHWEMSVGDSLLDKIEAAIDESSFLVVIISSNSVESNWVRTELKYAYYKEEEKSRTFILPILLNECKIPIHVAGRIFIDFRDEDEHAKGIQYLLNRLRGGKPFSQQVKDFLDSKSYSSPYPNKALREGQRILIELAQYREMDLEEHQKWILWELFHLLLEKYSCTLKMGNNPYSNWSKNSFIFQVVDRWNDNMISIVLEQEEFKCGLWKAEFDLMKTNTLTVKDLTFLGEKPRFSFQKKYNPHTETNPFLDSSASKMRPIINSLKETLNQFDVGSQQSFLYDLQHLIFARYPRNVEVVIGSGSEDLCYASSPFSSKPHAPSSSGWGIFEFYDPFFASLKYTALCPNHFSPLFEGDIDLMASQGEILLGPA